MAATTGRPGCGMACKWIRDIGQVLIAVSLSISTVTFAQDVNDYHPAEAESVGDVVRPLRSVAIGTVVLDVAISADGEVKNIQVRRAIASVTEVAVQAVKSWKFHAAQSKGKPVASRITVAVTFNPQSVTFPPVALTPLIHQDDEARIQSAFQPPEVTWATFPSTLTSAVGAVVLEVTVDEKGESQETKILRELAPHTEGAVRAVGDWEFMPATLNGKPVKAKVILAFVFPPPPISN